MIDQQELGSVAGRDVYGADGEKIGSVAQVYQDDRTGQPAWLTVHTGLFGMNESFVPLRDASVTGDRVEVPYDKSTVKDAPNVTADGHLDRRRNNASTSTTTSTGTPSGTGVGTPIVPSTWPATTRPMTATRPPARTPTTP